MMMLHQIIFLTLLMAISSCNNSGKTREKMVQSSVSDTLTTDNERAEKIKSTSEMVLAPSELNIISSLAINQKTENFEAGIELKDFLKIELIDKQFFDSKRSSSVNLLLADTAEIKKNNGMIEFKCQVKVKKYIDKPDAEENMQVFNYVGQFDFLNKYLIVGSYYEGLDYKFIDKTSCEETHTFGEYPIISASTPMLMRQRPT